MATYQSIRYNLDYEGKAGSLMPLLLFTSDGSDATATFATKIDSTYDEYLFIFNNIHPETDDVKLTFQGNAAGGSGYNETITSSVFRAQFDEGGSDANFLYNAAADQAQGTGFQQLSDNGLGNGNDESMSGWLRLYAPSSTTFIKHFIARNNMYQKDDYTNDNFIGGYFNTTAAIDDIQFKMSSGEIQGGTIGMFGVI